MLSTTHLHRTFRVGRLCLLARCYNSSHGTAIARSPGVGCIAELCVCVNIARLADSARRIIARSPGRTVVENEQIELDSFDPLRWFDNAPVRSDAAGGCWLSMIVEYSVALRIEQLAPLLETMPSEVVLEMQ